jgi:hypothetical protein
MRENIDFEFMSKKIILMLEIYWYPISYLAIREIY